MQVRPFPRPLAGLEVKSLETPIERFPLRALAARRRVLGGDEPTSSRQRLLSSGCECCAEPVVCWLTAQFQAEISYTVVRCGWKRSRNQVRSLSTEGEPTDLSSSVRTP